jgi:hypothetical protein
MWCCSSGGAPLGGTAAVESSLLTRLLSDGLGGNSLTLVRALCHP